MRTTSPLRLCIALVLLSLPAFADKTTGLPAGSRKAPAAAQETAEEAQFVALINAERKQRNLRPLTISPLLIQAARGHSCEMCDKSYFGHQSPTPALKNPMDRYTSGGGTYKKRVVVGENLYYCTRASVERGHTALMNSPGHRKNILSTEWEQVGVGIHHAPDGRFWVTEMFLLRQ